MTSKAGDNDRSGEPGVKMFNNDNNNSYKL